jgi:hypothetical protein
MLILHLVDPDPPGPPPTQSAAGQARAGEQWELSEWSLGAAAGPTMATLALGFGGSGGAAGAGPLVLAHGIRPSPARDGPALRCGTALEASSRSAPWPWTSGPVPPSSSLPRVLLRRRRRRGSSSSPRPARCCWERPAATATTTAATATTTAAAAARHAYLSVFLCAAFAGRGAACSPEPGWPLEPEVEFTMIEVSNERDEKGSPSTYTASVRS